MRKTEILTDRAIRNAKPDKDKTVKRLLDGGRLYLQATTSGACRSPQGALGEG